MSRSLTSCFPISSRSGDRIKQSTGELFWKPAFQLFTIDCAKGCVMSNGSDSRSYLLAIGSRRLGRRPKSESITQVLMKFSFKNLIFWSSERATALSFFPLPQHDSSIRGPFTEMAWMGFCCACARPNASSSGTQLICWNL